MLPSRLGGEVRGSITTNGSYKFWQANQRLADGADHLQVIMKTAPSSSCGPFQRCGSPATR
jgi:hypothetical protein